MKNPGPISIFLIAEMPPFPPGNNVKINIKHYIVIGLNIISCSFLKEILGDIGSILYHSNKAMTDEQFMVDVQFEKSNITLMNTNNNEEKSAIPIILTPIASLGPNADSSIPPIESLSDEKLREIEGSLRQNVISRIKTISEINQQLNGIVTQLNQVLSYMPEFPKTSDTTTSDSSSKEDNKTDINNVPSDPVTKNENINNDPKGKSVETTDNTPAPAPTSEPTTVENETKPETIEN